MADKQQDDERLIPEEEISDDGQVYVERDELDFDPDEGLYSGTAIDGSTDIPGPHEQAGDSEGADDGADQSDGEQDGESTGTDQTDEAGEADDAQAEATG